jgi:hypothetical protein
MAPSPKYWCPCFTCKSGRKLAKRTDLKHFKANLVHLAHVRESGAHQEADMVQECHDALLILLSGLDEGLQTSSRQFGSPYPDCECIFPHLFD